ncbi:MAG: ATP-binding cassette domain-containing protein [Wujia sp.]
MTEGKITETLQESNEDVQDSVQENENADLIVCDSVVKIYKTKEIEVMALQGLDLAIKRGELMSVIGKSGSGKSTLMNIIGGLEKPSAGQIIVDGRNLAELTEKEMVEYRKRMIGFVWQKSARNLFPYLNALENIEASMNFGGMKAKDRRKKALELLEMVGMSHKKDSYPGQMSGGEQQRVAIAVALANDPKILLADEPTGAVDTKTSDMIQDLFRKLNRELGITIIIVTHDMKLANKVDRVVMISDGKISTEKIMKEKYRQQIDQMSSAELYGDSHEEYSVMDKAHRVQLSEDILDAAGIDSNKLRITVEDGKVVIVGENKNTL